MEKNSYELVDSCQKFVSLFKLKKKIFEKKKLNKGRPISYKQSFCGLLQRVSFKSKSWRTS